MDNEFNRRWQHGEAPFDGVTLFLADYVPVPTLRPALTAVVDALPQGAYAQARMFELHDWHEHDGFLLEATPTTWEEIRAALASDEALRAASAGDAYVRTAWFPEARDFLLRFYVPDAYDNPFHRHDDPDLVHYGLFDVTAPEPLASQLQRAAQEAGAETTVLPARAFFDRNYRG